jgi:hypothetical protein
VYRGKFLDALRQAIQAGELPRDPASTELARRQRLKQLLRHGWVVYAKTPLAGPQVVLDYLSRYTHRVAVSNERIVGIDARGVRLRVRANDQGGKRTVFIDGPTFIERFLQHVLPPGFQAHPPLRAAQPGAQARADGPGACGAGRAGHRAPGLRGCGAVPAAHHGHRGLVLPALPSGAVAHSAVVAAAARWLDTHGSMQGTPLSPVGYITVHRPGRCRRPNGAADRAQPCENAAGAHFAKHRWATRHVHAPVSPRAARCLALPIPRICHASSG